MDSNYDSLDLFDAEFVEQYGSIQNLDCLESDVTGSWDLMISTNHYINDPDQQQDTPSIQYTQPIHAYEQPTINKNPNEPPELDRLSVPELRCLAISMGFDLAITEYKKNDMIKCIKEEWNDVYLDEYMKLLDVRTSCLNQRGRKYEDGCSAKLLLLNWAMAGNFVYLQVLFSNVPSFSIGGDGRHRLTCVDKLGLIEVTSNVRMKIVGKMYNKHHDPSIPKDGTILEFFFADGESGALNGTKDTIPSFYNESHNAHLVTPIDIDPRFNGIERCRHIKIYGVKLINKNKDVPELSDDDVQPIEFEAEEKNIQNEEAQEEQKKAITTRRKKRVIVDESEDYQEPEKKKKRITPKRKKNISRKKK